MFKSGFNDTSKEHRVASTRSRINSFDRDEEMLDKMVEAILTAPKRVRNDPNTPAVLEEAFTIAQAAETTARKADKAVKLAASSSELIKLLSKAGATIDVSHAGYVEQKGTFKDLVKGSSDAVVAAEATQVIAQLILNNEVSSVNNNVREPYFMGNGFSQGERQAQTLKKAASEHYDVAAKQLSNHGLKTLAASLREVAVSLRQEIPAAIRKDIKDKSPATIAFGLEWQEGRTVQDLAIVLGSDHYYPINQPYVDLLQSLQNATRKDAPVPQAAAPQPA